MPKAKGGSHTCPDCGSVFTRREYMERHRTSKHLGLRNHVCVCGNAYSRSDLLLRHKRACVSSSTSGPALSQQSTKQRRRKSTAIPVASTSSAQPSLADDRASNQVPSLTSSLSHSSGSPHDSPETVLDHHQLPVASTSASASYTAVEAASAAAASAAAASAAAANASSLLPPTIVSYNDSQSAASSAPIDATSFAFGTDTLAPAIGNPFETLKAWSSTRQGVPAGQGHPSHQPIHVSPREPSTFTHDEILASAVLEDLRSPRSFASSHSQLQQHRPESKEQEDSKPEVPWHGAQFANSSVSNTSVNALSSSWDSANIEYSDEARALADYFNRGGIGGITALDLGFPSEPSLFPAHMLTPPPVQTDDPFFLPHQKFCMGCAMPYWIPPAAKLSQYASNASRGLLKQAPVLHIPTTVLSDISGHTAFSLCVAGAALDSGVGEQFSNQMLVEKRLFLVRNFNKDDMAFEERFASVQSLLLYQLLSVFHKDEAQRTMAHTFHGALVSMYRQLDLSSKIGDETVTTSADSATLEQDWKHWIQLETYRRVAYTIYLTDIELATRHKSTPMLPFTELSLNLPSSDAAWEAKTAREWLAVVNSPMSPPSISFLEAMRVLLLQTDPAPFSNDGILLSQLQNLATFPRLVVTRTLAILREKTEEAIRQADPFRSFLRGLSVANEQDAEHRNLLERVNKGLARLKADDTLGRKWIMMAPSQPVTTEDEDLDACVSGERTKGTPSWYDASVEAVKAQNKLLSEFPDLFTI